MYGKPSTNPSPSKHFLFSKTSSRRLEDAFSVTPFVFQDLLKTSWRSLQDLFAIRLPKMFSRRLQVAFKTSSRRVCKTSCNYVFKTSRKTKKCYIEDVLKTSVRLHQNECLLDSEKGHVHKIWTVAFFVSIVSEVTVPKNTK